MVKELFDDRPGFADHVVRSTLQLKGGLKLKKSKHKKHKKHKKKHKEKQIKESTVIRARRIKGSWKDVSVLDFE